MELARASRRLRYHRKAWLESEVQMIVDDLYEAWQKRHFAEVWRLGHQLAAQCKGPRRRRYNVGACFLPRRAEIVQDFQQDGASGGLDAVPINFAEYRQACLEALPRAP
eukprot:6925027-Pyramimonas_sp.AAC.1